MSILAWPGTVWLSYVTSWNLASPLAVRKVFSWGAGHAEIKHLCLTHGTGNLRSLGVRSNKITAIIKVVEGEEGRFAVKH